MNRLPGRQPTGYTLESDKTNKKLWACRPHRYQIIDLYRRGAGLMLSLPLQWQDRGCYGIGGLNRLGALLRLYVCRSASACGLLGCCRGRVLITGAQLIRSGGRVHLRPIQSRLAAFELCFSALKFSCLPRASPISTSACVNLTT